MRRIFPLVLMLLLVLRGLVGTAMAAGMMPAGGPAHSAEAAQPLLHPAHSPDSPGNAGNAGNAGSPVLTATAAAPLGMVVHTLHAAAANPHGMAPEPAPGLHPPCAGAAPAACDGTSPDHAHSPLCSACEICHSALLAPPPPAAVPHGVSAGQVQAGASDRFASAAAALAIKPPIA